MKINDELNENNEQSYKKIKKEEKILSRKECPYLGTIKRNLLDFDFEKQCSISLSSSNVYCCLCCGKYFQGKGQNTYAYNHSIEKNHHMFINLHNQKIYCIPDNYQVDDPLLNDIKVDKYFKIKIPLQVNLNPTYTEEDEKNLDKLAKYSRGLDGTDFLPGCVGFNNIKQTDYINVVLQALCRIPKLRRHAIFFYNQKEENVSKLLLLIKFADFIRKVWNGNNFKGHVSPHELLQAISFKSNKKFKIEKQGDPIQFLAWFLREYINEEKYLIKAQNIINDCFQGKLRIYTQNMSKENIKQNINIQENNFYYLTLDIPSESLYKSDSAKLIIPHISIFELLRKFDGKSIKELANKNLQYEILQLPQYLILHLKRFSMNNFFMEKNKTIVSFPLNNLDLGNYLTQEIKDNIRYYKYNLLCNIIQEGMYGEGIYKIQVKHKGLNQWFEIQDLLIKPIMPQLVSVSEAYILIYENTQNID